MFLLQMIMLKKYSTTQYSIEKKLKIAGIVKILGNELHLSCMKIHTKVLCQASSQSIDSSCYKSVKTMVELHELSFE